MKTSIQKEVYEAPLFEVTSLVLPMNLLSDMSYPGELNGNFDDLVNQQDDWYQP